MILVRRDGEPIGKFTEQEFREKIFAGELWPEDLYRSDSMTGWAHISDYHAPSNGASERATKKEPMMALAKRKFKALWVTPDQPKVIVLDVPSILGLVGGLILVLGVFAPVVRAPLFGSVNYFQNGKGDGVILIISGIMSIAATVKRKFKTLWITGTDSIACAVFTIIRFVHGIDQLKKTMAEDDSIFSGLASAAVNSVELQWGLPLLICGAVLVLLAAAVGTGKLKLAISRDASPP